MTKIVPQKIDFEPPRDREFVLSLAQIPIRLRPPKPPYSIYKHENPIKQWELVKKILTEVQNAIMYGGHTVDILIFPELSIPYSDENKKHIIDYVMEKIEPPFIGIFPFDHIDLEKFCILLEKSDNDNSRKYADEIRDTANFRTNGKHIPVNFCSVVIKAKGGEIQEFIQAKNGPSTYESLSHHICPVYKYKYLHWFNSNNIDFIVLICSDLIKKMPHLIETVSSKMSDEKMNKWLNEKKKLDFLFIPQLNPKPNSLLFRSAKKEIYVHPTNELVSKDAYIISLNASTGSASVSKSHDFGKSSIMFNKKAKIQPTNEYALQTFEYDTDYPDLKEFKLTDPSPRLYFLRLILSRDFDYDPGASQSPITDTPIIKSVEDNGDKWTISDIKLREAIPSMELTKEEIDLFRHQYNVQLRSLNNCCSDELLKLTKENIIAKNELLERLITEGDSITYFHQLYVGNAPPSASKNVNRSIIKSVNNLKNRLDTMEEIVKELRQSGNEDSNLSTVLSHTARMKNELKYLQGECRNDQ